MKKVFIFPFFCGLLCLSQNTKKHTLINSITKEAIPFATIHYLNLDNGTYSDENGNFYLEQNLFDSIMVSSISYKATKFAVSKLTDSIYLVPKIEELNEVVLNSNVDEKEIGLHKKASNFSWYIEPSREFITSLKINEKYHDAHLIKIHFPIKKVQGVKLTSLKAIVRTNIYSSNTNQIVKDRIFSSEPVYCDVNSSETISFDVTDELIEINSDSLLIGIELLGFVNDQGKIQTDTKGSLRIPFTKKKTKDFSSKSYMKLIFSEKVEWQPLNDIIKKYVGLKNDYYLPVGLTLAFYED